MFEIDNGCFTSPLVREAANEQSEVASEGVFFTKTKHQVVGI